MKPSRSLSTKLAALGVDGRLRIAIADDSPLIRRQISEKLEEIPGVEIVGEAEGAGQALALIRDVKPHLLTLDIRMPAGDGFTLLRELKNIAQPPLVAVVTNYATAEYRKRCLELGACAFLDKSHQIEELIVLIEQLRQTKNRPDKEP